MPGNNPLISRPRYFILHLTAGQGDLFSLTGNRMCHHAELSLTTPEDIQPIADKFNSAPWLVLVDQPEEDFWGQLMPPLRGKARAVWLEKLAAKSTFESNFRWVQVHGRSRSNPGKLRVLGYSLGQPEALTEWLEALSAANIRVRGLYSPALLAESAMQRLEIKSDGVAVLVTPHRTGWRQCVMVAGKLRFSRLAVITGAQEADWAATLQAETEKLHDYLLGNGLLKNTSTFMEVFYVQPDSQFTATNALPKQQAEGHSYVCLSAAEVKKRLRLQSPAGTFTSAESFYVWLLALRQPKAQLAPLRFRQIDVSKRIAGALYLAGAAIFLVALLFAAFSFYQIFSIEQESTSASTQLNRLNTAYEREKESFPKSAIGAEELRELETLWRSTVQAGSSTPLTLMSLVGGVLRSHESLRIDELTWKTERLAAPRNMPGMQADAVEDSLQIKGVVLDLASDNLRGGRDATLELVADLKKRDGIQVDIVHMPFDLLPNALVTDSGDNSKNEANFEVRVWSRRQ
ncbi:MAG: hypothetical protein RLZZ298_1290 [Pseudomonadota bacterium]|jgi:hypothetical protein